MKKIVTRDSLELEFGPDSLETGLWLTTSALASPFASPLEATVPGDDFDADVNTTGVLVVDGPSVTVRGDFEGDVDWLRFDAVAGEEYLLTGLSTGFDIPQIYDATGALVSDLFLSPFSEAIIGGLETGEYFVAVSLLITTARIWP